jgi:hypothetical protein
MVKYVAEAQAPLIAPAQPASWPVAHLASPTPRARSRMNPNPPPSNPISRYGGSPVNNHFAGPECPFRRLKHDLRTQVSKMLVMNCDFYSMIRAWQMMSTQSVVAQNFPSISLADGLESVVRFFLLVCTALVAPDTSKTSSSLKG